MSFWSLNANKLETFVTIEKAFSASECQDLVDRYKDKTGVATLDVEKRIDHKYRDSNVYWVIPEEDESLFRKLTDLVNYSNNEFFGFDLLGFSEGVQFTQYTQPGGFYTKHVDCLHKGSIRKLSLTVQLTDPNEYEGGDLLLHFKTDPVTAPRSQGTVTVFPSYLLHEVTPVTKGLRHSLVAWITGPQFK
jgi:PKHD-type hydroxylase